MRLQGALITRRQEGMEADKASPIRDSEWRLAYQGTHEGYRMVRSRGLVREIIQPVEGLARRE